MQPIRIITLNPGHFHAALVQKEMYAQVARRVHVYGPLGPDLTNHLGRIAGFNGRRDNPTSWDVQVYAGPDYLECMQDEKAGNVVVIAGRNANKINAILVALESGMHVLADKPWILIPDDLPKLQHVLEFADRNQLIACDIMTERHEITSLLQRELIQDDVVFGTILPGSPDEPAVFMESVHYLKKSVAGVPLRRPAWFFDIHEQGEALTDVGTHLVDLASWMLFPDQAIESETDICLLAAKRWPTVLTKAQFQQITGEKAYPEYLRSSVERDELHYFCNTLVEYALRNVHLKLKIMWDVEAIQGGDTHCAIFRGSRACIEVRQDATENQDPELFVTPNKPSDHSNIRRALELKIQSLQKTYPNICCVDQTARFHVSIPAIFRVGHEAHFAQVTKQFIRYVLGQDRVPTCEKPNMLAKYFLTTRGVDLSRRAHSDSS